MDDAIIPPKKETAAFNRGGTDHVCKHEHDTALRLQIRTQLYTMKRKNRAVRAALPKTHPKNHSPLKKGGCQPL